MPPRKRLKPGDNVLLSLAVNQVELIIEHLPVGPGLLATLYHSRVWDGVVKVKCTLDELAELTVCVAAKANNTTDERLQLNLEAIAEAISEVEQRYWVSPRLVRASRQ